MRYFAKVVDGIVEKVLVAEPEFFDTYVEEPAGIWIETFQDGSLRKHSASVGFSYDSNTDAFIPPKPFPSWVLNTQTYLWDAPVAYPTDGEMYRWDEPTGAWVI